MNSAAEIASCLCAASSVGLICHVNPDGDTIGSALALHLALRGLGKETRLYCKDAVPPHMRMMEGADCFSSDPSCLAETEILATIDCGDTGRMGDSTSYMAGKETVINIDHHGTNPLYGTVNLVRECGATAEIVWDILQEMGCPVTPAIGACLYAGIVTDTGRFSFSNTTPETHRIAAKLLEADAPVESVIEAFYRTNSWERTRLIGECLHGITRHADGQVVIMTLPLSLLHECGALPSDSEGLVNYAVDVAGAQIGILVQEKTPGFCKLSFRSRGKYPVDTLAARFGGGGHRNAAGGGMEGDVETVKAVVLAAAMETVQA